MTTPAKAVEADAASIAFQIALTQIGAATIQDALKLWAGVPPTRTATTSAAWLKQAINLVMSRRALSRDLAMAYYRLVRALRTGKTIADPRHPDPPVVTLQMLRDQFALLAPAVKPQEGPPRSSSSGTRPRPVGSQPPSEPVDDGSETIPVEEIDGIEQEQDRLEQSAKTEVGFDLQALGPDNLDKKVAAIPTDAPASQVDAAREDAHSRAGTRQAATAERVAMDAARGNVWAIAQKDKRAIGYVRLSRTGTPCGWCAMLIGRGAVYKSSKSAEYADGDLYHDNCHCYAEPIFDDEQYANSTLTELNRKYFSLWPKVTKGLKGKAAVSAWRRFIRQEAAAQEAG